MWLIIHKVSKRVNLAYPIGGVQHGVVSPALRASQFRCSAWGTWCAYVYLVLSRFINQWMLMVPKIVPLYKGRLCWKGEKTPQPVLHPAKTRVICMACRDYDAHPPIPIPPFLCQTCLQNRLCQLITCGQNYVTCTCHWYLKGMSWRKGYKSLSLSCRDCIAKAEFATRPGNSTATIIFGTMPCCFV